MYAAPEAELTRQQIESMFAAGGDPGDDERAAIHWANRVARLRLCGAVVRRGKMEWWPAPRRCSTRAGQVRHVPAMGYFAGCRDWTRGRHWDMRSRYGLR